METVKTPIDTEWAAEALIEVDDCKVLTVFWRIGDNTVYPSNWKLDLEFEIVFDELLFILSGFLKLAANVVGFMDFLKSNLNSIRFF